MYIMSTSYKSSQPQQQFVYSVLQHFLMEELYIQLYFQIISIHLKSKGKTYTGINMFRTQ